MRSQAAYQTAVVVTHVAAAAAPVFVSIAVNPAAAFCYCSCCCLCCFFALFLPLLLSILLLFLLMFMLLSLLRLPLYIFASIDANPASLSVSAANLADSSAAYPATVLAADSSEKPAACPDDSYVAVFHAIIHSLANPAAVPSFIAYSIVRPILLIVLVLIP